MYLCSLKLTTMKSIFLFLFLSCQFLANGQTYNTEVVKESIENYYAKKKAENSFQFVKSEITSIESSFEHVADSLSVETLNKMIKQTLNLYKKSDEYKKNSYAQLTMMTLDIYFEAKERYNKRNKTKVYLAKGNILYSVMENFQKKTMYENFIMIFSTDYKVLSHFVLD